MQLSAVNYSVAVIVNIVTTPLALCVLMTGVYMGISIITVRAAGFYRVISITVSISTANWRRW